MTEVKKKNFSLEFSVFETNHGYTFDKRGKQVGCPYGVWT